MTERSDGMSGAGEAGANFTDLLGAIPNLPQRQDSLSDQLSDLRAIANRLGMYDAADAIGRIFGSLESVKYGCHCDLEDGQQPDGCVIDDGLLRDCVHAKPNMRKEQCEYWRVIASSA